MLDRRKFSATGTVYAGETVPCCCSWHYGLEAEGDWPDDACEFCERHGGNAHDMNYEYEFCETHENEFKAWRTKLMNGEHLPPGSTLPLWEEE